MNRVLLLAGAVLCSAGVASAQVTILSQLRELEGEVHIGRLFGGPVDYTNSFSHTVTDFAGYPSMNDMAPLTFRDASAMAFVQHTTVMGDGEFSFDSKIESTYADFASEPSEISGASRHSVLLTFRVEEAISYVFSASVAHSAPNGSAAFSLIGEGLDVSVSSNGSGSVSSSGVLQPGEYTLSGSGMFSFDQLNGDPEGVTFSSKFLASFTFTPVPAPGAALMLAMGAGLAFRRRR